MEKVRELYLRSWRGLALAVSLALIAYVLYFHRLGSLLPGYSTPELRALHTANDWHSILRNPVNAPYSLLVWLLTAVVHRGILMTRVVAASFGLLAGLLFFAVVRAWCTYRAAFLATVMFVTSSGLLHFARLGTGYILQMSVLALLGCVLWYRYQRRHRQLIAYCIAVVFVLLWYVPGMIWFELLGLLLLGVIVRGQLRQTKTLHLIALLVLCLALAAPLIAAAMRKPKVLLQAAGLPQSWPSVAESWSRLWHTILGIAVYSNGNPLFWFNHAPMLSAIEVILGVLGGIYLYRKAPRRGLFLFGWIVIGLLLGALGGGVVVACLVPALYLCIAIGLDYLLGQWLSVFPRNPVARTLGVGVVCVMLLFSVVYQLRVYYVAWPHAPATRQVFRHSAP